MLPALLLASGAVARAQRPGITGVSHLAVYTTDAAASERFYTHDLGATRGSDPQNPAGVRYYFNAVQFVRVLPLPAGDTRVDRFDHIGFNVADADAMRAYLAARQIAVPAAASTASDGSRYFEVTDPEGNRVQFVQVPQRPAAVPVDALSRHVTHVGLVVHSAALEDSFYRDLLGFRPYWKGGMKEDAPTWISQQVPNGRDWLEYMLVSSPVSHDTAGVLDHFALGIPNAEAAMEMLYSGDRLSGKHSDPKIGRDGKWQINLYDPDGTRAELMEFRSAAKPCCSPILLPGPTE